MINCRLSGNSGGLGDSDGSVRLQLKNRLQQSVNNCGSWSSGVEVSAGGGRSLCCSRAIGVGPECKDMSRQRLESQDELSSVIATDSGRGAAAVASCGPNLNSALVRRLVWRVSTVAGCVVVLSAATLLPLSRFLSADTGGNSDAAGWTIELVPRSVGPQPRGQSPDRPDRLSRRETTAAATEESEVPASIAGRSEPLTPLEKGWERVESEPSSAERAVPLNAVRATAPPKSAAASRESVARPLNAVVSRGVPVPEQGAVRSAVRPVSSSRSKTGNHGQTASAEAPIARLKTPNFARREYPSAVQQPQPVEQPQPLPVGASPAVAFKAPSAAAAREARSVAASPRYNSGGVAAGHAPDSRPMAGALPEAVRPDERAQPLMASDSRSAAMAAVTRRSARRSAAVVTPESRPSAAEAETGRIPSAVSSVTAPDPERSVAEREDRHDPASGPLAGHSLFVDPFPLVPTFAGSSPAYRSSGRRSSSHVESPYGRRLPTSGYYVTPNVIPQRSIPHTGWYDSAPGVRSISHTEDVPAAISGHSVFDR